MSKIQILRYEVTGNRHGPDTMTTQTLRRAIALCRAEYRDGWPVKVRRLTDDRIVYEPPAGGSSIRGHIRQETP